VIAGQQRWPAARAVPGVAAGDECRLLARVVVRGLPAVPAPDRLPDPGFSGRPVRGPASGPGCTCSGQAAAVPGPARPQPFLCRPGRSRSRSGERAVPTPYCSLARRPSGWFLFGPSRPGCSFSVRAVPTVPALFSSGSPCPWQRTSGNADPGERRSCSERFPVPGAVPDGLFPLRRSCLYADTAAAPGRCRSSHRCLSIWSCVGHDCVTACPHCAAQTVSRQRLRHRSSLQLRRSMIVLQPTVAPAEGGAIGPAHPADLSTSVECRAHRLWACGRCTWTSSATCRETKTHQPPTVPHSDR
jgi:hypothetical protein